MPHDSACSSDQHAVLDHVLNFDFDVSLSDLSAKLCLLGIQGDFLSWQKSLASLQGDREDNFLVIITTACTLCGLKIFRQLAIRNK